MVRTCAAHRSIWHTGTGRSTDRVEIETTPDRLRDVDGIGPLRAASILAAWAEQKIVREIMVLLHSHGVSTARAVRIFKTYGADAPQVMTQNLRCGRVFSRLT